MMFDDGRRQLELHITDIGWWFGTDMTGKFFGETGKPDGVGVRAVPDVLDVLSRAFDLIEDPAATGGASLRADYMLSEAGREVERGWRRTGGSFSRDRDGVCVTCAGDSVFAARPKGDSMWSL